LGGFGAACFDVGCSFGAGFLSGSLGSYLGSSGNGISTEESSNLWVIRSTVHMYQPHLINVFAPKPPKAQD
jgi:hypothetical protein